MPLSVLDPGTGSGVELGFTLGEVREARGSIAVPSLAPLAPPVLLPEDPLRAAAGAGIPRLGQNSLKHQKLHLGGWQKQRLSWDGSTFTLPFLCPCSLRGLAILLQRHHCPQRPPQPPPEDHHDFLKTTTTSQRPPRSPEAPTTVTTPVQIPAQPGWAPQTLPVPPLGTSTGCGVGVSTAALAPFPLPVAAGFPQSCQTNPEKNTFDCIKVQTSTWPRPRAGTL